MASAPYRYYRLDSTGNLYNAERLEAESEKDAIAQVQARHPDATSEIWCDKRLVAKVSPTSLRS